jgi:sugar lactone lactonase YvrE
MAADRHPGPTTDGRSGAGSAARRRTTVLAAAILAALLVSLPAVAGAPAASRSLPLPDGFYPEGIAIGTGNDFYVGSLLDGAIYRGDVRTGAGEILVEGAEGRIAVGLSYDARSGLLWAAGLDGGAGAALGFDTRSGELATTIPIPGALFLNDVVVARDALYLTDSFADRLWTIPLRANGRPAGPASSVPLSGDFTYVTTGVLPLNLNGIEVTPDGRTLLAVHTSLGVLYRIDPTTGVATQSDLGGATLPAADGILLQGRTLYVVQNFLDRIAVLRLAPDLGSGEVVDVITSELFRVPTTVARRGDRLYAVNARFDVAFPPGFGGAPVVIDYDVVEVRR